MLVHFLVAILFIYGLGFPYIPAGTQSMHGQSPVDVGSGFLPKDEPL